MQKIQLNQNSWIKIQNNAFFLTPEEFDELWKLRPETSQTVIIMGKEIKIPRKQDIYGTHSYAFSGKRLIPKPIDHPILQNILNFINQQDNQYQYQDIFINWYQGGEYIGPHSDSEKDLNSSAPIYSLSFGGKRLFRIQEKSNLKPTPETIIKKDILMDDGMLIVMGGKMQQEYKHSVPKLKKHQQPRINLTFRIFT